MTDRQPQRSSGVVATLSSIVVIVAILWLALSGLCTAGGLLFGLASLSSSYGGAWLFVEALVIGGVAIGVGLLALWLGRKMQRGGRPPDKPPQAGA